MVEPLTKTEREAAIRAIAEGYEIPADAVRAALAYYDRHRAVIDARLLLNADAS